ncbi:hypothetical protein FSP39_020744 [Pinctada imbricata]|uniref:Uncharacterized protein n=1 Tax=Pinctada imbricata TaxID=66713 RepID=A0AA88YF49_PINIB|nr:hypothetical protein FSP39_020744 [Pinctada imbricata]
MEELHFAVSPQEETATRGDSKQRRQQPEETARYTSSIAALCYNDKSQIIDVSAVPTLKTVKGDDNEDDDKAQTKDVVCKNKVLCMAFSRSGKYFAVCDDVKRVLLYQSSEDYRLLSQRSVPKRCSALTFTHDESYVLVADRHGDVYRLSVAKETEEGKLLLGHLSMLLDIVLTRNDQYIVTCDRDEKIRISNYPNAYNIHGYCLQHSE